MLSKLIMKTKSLEMSRNHLDHKLRTNQANEVKHDLNQLAVESSSDGSTNSSTSSVEVDTAIRPSFTQNKPNNNESINEFKSMNIHSDNESDLIPKNYTKHETSLNHKKTKTLNQYNIAQKMKYVFQQAKNSFKLDSYTSDKNKESDDVKYDLDKGDETYGQLEPWPIATSITNVAKRSQSYESPRSTDIILKKHSENLLNSLKEATLQLSRRDLEMQRLIAVNSQLGERYCRLRKQYTELAREQARLRQRYDMLIIQAMDREQLKEVNTKLETQLNETQKLLISAEERDNLTSKRLGRIEAEAREVALAVTNNDVTVANLRNELNRKQAKIQALKIRQRLDAAREMQARIYLNELVELKGNIRVLVRCLSTSDTDGSAFKYFGDDTLIVKPDLQSPGYPVCSLRSSHQAYTFHRVFPPNTKQRTVFEEISELVTSCVDGYSVAIVSYGQSGSGKTYTLLGAPNKPGIIPRAARHIISQCQQRSHLWIYKLSIAVVQIYKEIILDLLAEDKNTPISNTSGRVILHDNGKQIILRGATEKEVKSEEEILDEIRKARSRRQTLANTFNTPLSHLHFIVLIRVRGACKLENFGEHINDLGCVKSQNKCTNNMKGNGMTIKNSTIRTSTPILVNENLKNLNSEENDIKNDFHPNHADIDDVNEPGTQFLTHGLLMFADLAGFDSINSIQQRSVNQTITLTNRTYSGTVTSGLVKQSKSQLPPTSPFSLPTQQQVINTQSKNNSTPNSGLNMPVVRKRSSFSPNIEMDINMETKQLGRSLITLGRVFDCLVDNNHLNNNRQHIPFRDSKLTHLLKPTLLGDSKFVLLVTINTQKTYLDATMRSLKIACKASDINLGYVKRNGFLTNSVRSSNAVKS